jgi:hypothetical protein
MDHVEVLMRLHGAAGNPVIASELRGKTHLDDRTFSTVIADLVKAHLVSGDVDGYRSDPATHTDRKAVDALALVYHQQPLNLAKLVYEQPSEPLKSFSDAFRIRDPKDKKDK